MIGLFQQIFLGTLVFLISVLFFGMTMLIRSFPALYDLMNRLMRSLLILSYRAYYFLLMHLEPYWLTISAYSLLNNPIRTLVTTLISIFIGCVFCLIVQWKITLIAIGICIFHGGFIGLAWQDFFEPVGLHMGEGLQ